MPIALAWLAACGSRPGRPTHTWRAELEGEQATAAVDAPRIADRLSRLGGEVHVRPAAPDRVEVRVAGSAVPASELQRLLVPGVLRIGEGPGSLGNAQLAEAEVAEGVDGRPRVRLKLTEAGGRAFCALSSAQVGRELPVVVDDVVLMAPRIAEPICGGTVEIHLGNAANDPAREAFALAAALRPDALTGRWSVAVLDVNPSR